MKLRHSTGGLSEKVELQMTPMIDIVFQLLSFFIMTFQIGVAEGDFNIKMPLLAPAAGPPSDIALPPIRVRLISDARGALAGVLLNDRTLGGRDPMDALRLEIVGILGDDRGPGSIQETAEVELACDFNLHYEHTIDAITAVSGYRDDEGGVVKLVEKIKFAPPQTASGG
jgi:hypothetical protein